MTQDHELERELLAHPAFADGALQFVRRLAATHSDLLEYRFKSRDGMQSIIVKQQAFGPNSERATLQEFANLGRIRALLGPALRGSVPEPLFAVPDKGMLVTSKVPGVPLAVILKKYANRLASPFLSSSTAETARRVGMWLRSFQDATHAESLSYTAGSYLDELEMWLSPLREKGFEFGFTREILERASLNSSHFNGRIISAAAKHGDFIPQNILIEHDEVAVVDFEEFGEREAVYEDLGRFLGYLLVLGARGLYSPRSLAAVRHGFLAGFRAGGSIDEGLLNIYILKGAVRIIADAPPLKGKWSRFGSPWLLTTRLKNLASGAGT